MTKEKTINDLRYEAALKKLKDPWTIRYYQWFQNTITTAAENLRIILKLPN